jgi:hypothetical protein
MFSDISISDTYAEMESRKMVSLSRRHACGTIRL